MTTLQGKCFVGVLVAVFVVASLFTCCCSSVNMVNAQSSLEQFNSWTQNLGLSYPLSGHGDEVYAQTFTADTYFNLSIISLDIGWNYQHTGTIYVYNSSLTGKPDQILSSVNYGGGSSSSTPVWMNFSLPSPVPLVANRVYWLIFVPDNVGGSYDANVRVSRNDASGGYQNYVGGGWSYATSISGLSHSVNALFDANFILYGYASSPFLPGEYSYTFQNVLHDASPQSYTDSAAVTVTDTTGITHTFTIAPQGSYTFNTVQLLSATWNFSSALNVTRTIEFLPSDGTLDGQMVFPLLVSSQDYTFSSYVFNLVDYTSSAEWLEVWIGNNLVERRNILLTGSADFVLYRGLTYTVVVRGELGTFSQTFTASNIYSTNVILLSGSFGDDTTVQQSGVNQYLV